MAVNSETLTSLRSAVRDTINEPTESFITDVEINRWLNQGILKVICRLEGLEFEQVITMVSGTASYALPNDHQNTIDVQYVGSEYRLLAWMSPGVYRSLSSLGTAGIPSHYTIINNDLYVYPTPSSDTDTVSHRYTASPNKLTNDTDIPYNDITRFYPYHLDLVDFASAKGLAKKSDLTKADYHEALFETNVINMIAELSSRRKGGLGQIARSDKNSYQGKVQLPGSYPF